MRTHSHTETRTNKITHNTRARAHLYANTHRQACTHVRTHPNHAHPHKYAIRRTACNTAAAGCRVGMRRVFTFTAGEPVIQRVEQRRRELPNASRLQICIHTSTRTRARVNGTLSHAWLPRACSYARMHRRHRPGRATGRGETRLELPGDLPRHEHARLVALQRTAKPKAETYRRNAALPRLASGKNVLTHGPMGPEGRGPCAASGTVAHAERAC